MRSAPALLWTLVLALIAGCNVPPSLIEVIDHEREVQNYGYKVVRVIDGNTFIIDLSDKGDGASYRRVRLAGIQAPEFREFKEAGGKDARDFLQEFLRDQYVVLKFDTAFYGPPLDAEEEEAPQPHIYSDPLGAYIDPDTGTIYAYVSAQGVSVNKLILQKGLARVSGTYRFSRKSVRDEYLSIEAAARRNRVGLWR
jgi:endonuclease YncB( thermonuclease family)